MKKQTDCASVVEGNWAFNQKSIAIIGMSVMAFGGYIGILIETRYFRTFCWEGMLDTHWTKSLVRVVVILLILAPFGVIFLAVPDTANLSLIIAFKTTVPCLLMFFFLFGFGNLLFVKLKLVSFANFLGNDEERSS